MQNIIKILGKQKAGLNPQIFMAGFNGNLDIVQAEDRIEMKDRLLDGKAL